MNLLDPQTDQEWQEAVNIAAALRTIADVKMYGLMEGGPEINVERCDEIVEQGAARGFTPKGQRSSERYRHDPSDQRRNRSEERERKKQWMTTTRWLRLT